MRVACSSAGLAAAACLVLLTGGCGADRGAHGTGTSGVPAVGAAASASEPAATAPGGQVRSVQLVVATSGDLLIHSPIYERALVQGGGGYPVFNTPPELAAAIHLTGWRACSTASNHTLDQGQRGVDATIAALNQAGVLHTGSFSSAAGQAKPLIITVVGLLRLGILRTCGPWSASK